MNTEEMEQKNADWRRDNLGKNVGLANVTHRYIFESLEDDNDFTFEVNATGYKEAYNLAYENHGPQVVDMVYRKV